MLYGSGKFFSWLRAYILLLIFFVPFSNQAQVTVSGCITDASDNSPIEHVSVVLYKFNSNQIVTYSFTNSEGCFKLQEVPKGVYSVKANMLGYHPFSKELVIAADSANLLLSFNLSQETTVLEGVEIRGIQPIIVKQDTIIYNIGHWTQATDRTLEEVLARIPGFKIRGDGELSVNGKPIDKVIIDGKEVSDGGAALITRSISPENIKEIQVRLDEQDAALKESLIDTRKLVVLDIRLRDDVNKSFFGLVRASVGHQKTTQPGGYGNVFSLRKKTNLHFFAEHDQFGEQTISLDQIKNIGQEAFQKIFDIPADFNEISEKQDFNREIYGFKDYTGSTNNVLGATGHHRLNERIQVFFGSYNAYQLLERQRGYQQRFFDGPETGFKEINSLKNFSSKNKVEFRFDHAKIKARADLNAVIINDRNSDNNRALTEVAYQFDDKLNAANLYQNGVFEYLPGGSWAFQLKTAFAQRAGNHIKILQHNDTTYGQFIINQAVEPVFSLRQGINNRHTSWHSEAGVFFKKPWGQTSLQFRNEFQRLQMEKRATDQAAEAPMNNVPDFTLPVTKRPFQKFGPGLRQSIKLGQFNLAGELFYTTSTFPQQNGILKAQSLPEYKLSFDYNRNVDHIIVSWTKRISAFSLHKIMAGYTLQDFQNVSVIGPTNLTPQPEEVLEIWTGKNFSSINLMIDPTLIMGRTRTGDQVVVGDLPVVSLYNQLEASFIAASLALTKTFTRIPLQLVLEPELINSFQDNIDQNGKRYITKTERQMIGLKVTSDFERKTFHFFIYPKFTSFHFSSELDPVPSTQQMVSLECRAGWAVMKQLSISSTWRHVVFSGTSESRFTNGALQIRYSWRKFVAWLEADNMLNNSLFVRQTISPNVFVDNREAVFSRYLKAGFDLKFR